MVDANNYSSYSSPYYKAAYYLKQNHMTKYKSCIKEFGLDESNLDYYIKTLDMHMLQLGTSKKVDKIIANLSKLNLLDYITISEDPNYSLPPSCETNSTIEKSGFIIPILIDRVVTLFNLSLIKSFGIEPKNDACIWRSLIHNEIKKDKTRESNLLSLLKLIFFIKRLNSCFVKNYWSSVEPNYDYKYKLLLSKWKEAAKQTYKNVVTEKAINILYNLFKLLNEEEDSIEFFLKEKNVEDIVAFLDDIKNMTS
jgi:hypothetical protein